MSGQPESSQSPSDVDLRDLKDVEARVSRLAERFAQHDPRIAESLAQEARLLRDLLSRQAAGSDASAGAAGASAHGNLHRLRELLSSAVAGGLYEEAKDASLLMLLNRLLGI